MIGRSTAGAAGVDVVGRVATGAGAGDEVATGAVIAVAARSRIATV
jgi:hypothetical protein